MKADFFSRLIECSLGQADTAQPVLPSRFEPLVAGVRGDRLSQPFGSDSRSESNMGVAEKIELRLMNSIPPSTFFPEAQEGTDALSSSASKPKNIIADKDRDQKLIESGFDDYPNSRIKKAPGTEFPTKAGTENEIPVLNPVSAFDLRPPISSALEANQRDIDAAAIKKASEPVAMSESDIEKENTVLHSKSALDIPAPNSSASKPHQIEIAANTPSKRDTAQSPNNWRSSKLSQAEHGHETVHPNVIAVEARVIPPNLAQGQAELKSDGKLRQSAKTKPGNESPTVKVHIGRIEVRAVMSSTQPVSPRKATRPVPTLSLDEYLKQHSGARR
jgi:hypothetical protein